QAQSRGEQGFNGHLHGRHLTQTATTPIAAAPSSSAESGFSTGNGIEPLLAWKLLPDRWNETIAPQIRVEHVLG
ncbi:MAG: hypothetical protein N3C12_11210, partial [Candidatus Binatia bacterium]|nr:hypothetical protein [Candidatus Binatia bacterium]